MLYTTHYMEEAFQLCDRLIIMHKGENIMEGKPKDLLKEKIEKYVLEIYDTGLSEHKYVDKPQEHIRVENTPGIVRYYSNDIDALRKQAKSNFGSVHYVIRETNLEDVFLTATGRQLNDRQ